MGQDYGSYKGYFAENFVAQEFLCRGQESLYSWQEKTAEVEFLLQKEGKVIPVEVKSGWVIHGKSLSQFVAKYHPPFKIILSAQNLAVERERYPLYMAANFI